MKFPLPDDMPMDPGAYIVRLGLNYPYRAVVTHENEVVLIDLTEEAYEQLGEPLVSDWNWNLKEAGKSAG